MPERPGEFELITLRSGDRAVRHLVSGEVMHPSVGPWREANRLYVEQPRLAERLVQGSAPLRILDVGLGAAANAVAALECARGVKGARRVELVSLERDLAPLELALGDLAGFPFLAGWQEQARALIASGSWASPQISWSLLRGEVLEQLPKAGEGFELVFFDPFSPESNPGLWTRASLALIRARCGDDAFLITYSAATPTRVALLLAGFFVGTGVSVGGKAETTLAATRLESLEQPLGTRWLERWKRSTARAPHGEALNSEIEQAVIEHRQWQGLG